MPTDEYIIDFETRWQNTISTLKNKELSPEDVLRLKSRYKIDEFLLKQKLQTTIAIDFYQSRIQNIKQLFDDFLQEGKIIYREKQHERNLAFYETIAKIIAGLVALVVAVGGIVYLLK